MFLFSSLQHCYYYKLLHHANLCFVYVCFPQESARRGIRCELSLSLQSQKARTLKPSRSCCTEPCLLWSTLDNNTDRQRFLAFEWDVLTVQCKSFAQVPLLQQTYMGQRLHKGEPFSLATSDCRSLVLPSAGCKSWREFCFLSARYSGLSTWRGGKITRFNVLHFILQQVAFMIRKNKTKNYYLWWSLADDLRVVSFVSFAAQQRGEKAAAGVGVCFYHSTASTSDSLNARQM